MEFYEKSNEMFKQILQSTSILTWTLADLGNISPGLNKGDSVGPKRYQ